HLDTVTYIDGPVPGAPRAPPRSTGRDTGSLWAWAAIPPQGSSVPHPSPSRLALYVIVFKNVGTKPPRYLRRRVSALLRLRPFSGRQVCRGRFCRSAGHSTTSGAPSSVHHGGRVRRAGRPDRQGDESDRAADESGPRYFGLGPRGELPLLPTGRSEQ